MPDDIEEDVWEKLEEEAAKEKIEDPDVLPEKTESEEEEERDAYVDYSQPS